MSLIKKVRETIRRYNLLSRNDKVVIGVSGGPDSVALTYLLNLFKKELRLHLHIAHLDHQLRKDSYKDREFVRALAKKLNLPFISEKINVSKVPGKSSIEEIAREARLKFLFKVAKCIGANKIALGHNQDDQAETVLMRLIRGTGLAGVSSILPRRRIGNWVIIRPLIETPRKAIDVYLKRRRIKPCLDLSNKDIVYFRNRIRNRLLPLLSKEYNPNIKEVLANFAKIAAYDYDYLENISVKAFNRLKSPLSKLKGSSYAGIRLKLNRLSKLHPSIQRLALRFAIAQIKGTSRRLCFKHIREIDDLILYRPIGSIVDLPEGICALKRKNSLWIYRKK